MLTLKEKALCLLATTNLKKTDHLVVCFDSDDWGVTRCSSDVQKEKIREAGLHVDGDPFVSFDCVENYDDVIRLANLLHSFSDCQGNHPIFTLNFSIFSPDFSKIIQNNFSTYVFFPFYQNYGDLEEQKKMLSLFLEKRGLVFDYELHGAEHMNVRRFLSDARKGAGFAKESASFGVSSLLDTYSKRNPFGYMDELRLYSEDDIDFAIERLACAKKEFAKIFGNDPVALTPSCSVFSPRLVKKLPILGFKYLKVSVRNFEPTKNGKLKSSVLFRKKESGINCYARYARFEPSRNPDSVNHLLDLLSYFDHLGKPCVVSTHRLNYASKLNRAMRDGDLETLETLLLSIKERFPNVEYMSTNKCFSLFGK